VVDAFCGAAVLRGADIFAPGVLGAPNCMTAGDKVSVFVDLEGSCLKGRTAVFQGRKEFVGNGIAKLSRADLFKYEHTFFNIQSTSCVQDLAAIQLALQSR